MRTAISEHSFFTLPAAFVIMIVFRMYISIIVAARYFCPSLTFEDIGRSGKIKQ